MIALLLLALQQPPSFGNITQPEESVYCVPGPTHTAIVTAVGSVDGTLILQESLDNSKWQTLGTVKVVPEGPTLTPIATILAVDPLALRLRVTSLDIRKGKARVTLQMQAWGPE